MATQAPRTLRDQQIASIQKILNLNQDTTQSQDHAQDPASTSSLQQPTPILGADGEPIWKVLVFDNLGRDVISAVLRVKDLRNWGVTIHLPITATRHPIPDVPVVYLVQPTEENLKAITTDLSRSLYSPAYINFLSSIPRPLLENFAAETASAGTADHLAQIYDQYLNFIVTEPDLFSLGMGKEIYRLMNSAETKDEEIDIAIDRIVSGLFSVAVTMGTIPIIRCPKGGAAEMIAAKLDRKLRDHVLNSRDNLFSGGNQKSSAAAHATLSRPVLVIVDRNVDLVPMLSHSWTYQSLVHDVLKMHLNKVTVSVVEENKAPYKTNYSLSSNDSFWARNAGLPFPQVAEDVDTELIKWKEESTELTKKKGATYEDLASGAADTSQIKAALTQLPELRERKAALDMHMNILSDLLRAIKDRQLDNFSQLEENIQKQTKAQMLEFIQDADKGSEPMDKLRLFVIWFLSTEQELSRAEMDRFEEALRATGVETTSLAYIKRVREITRMTMMSSAPSQPSQPSASADLFKGFSSISNRLTDRFRDAGLGANFENLVSGIKNFLPANRDLTLTKITESLMDPQNASSSAIAKTEGYLYFDPRSANARGTVPPASQIRNAQGGMGNVGRGIEASFGQRRQGFTEAIVFTVGGGSMEEYGNLQDWAQRTSTSGTVTGPKRRVVYGSTELVNPEDFVNCELAKLGSEST